MRIVLRFSLCLAFAAACLLQSGLVAGEKKKKDNEPEKKKEAVKDTTVNGELTNTDVKDKVKTDCYCKTYTYKMVGGRTYEIVMRSKDLDSWLRLEDAAGKNLAEDDDSGGDLDSLISFKATKSSDYTIICTTFSASETGKFVLTVKDVTVGDANPPKKEKLPPQKLPPVKGNASIDRSMAANLVVVREIGLSRAHAE
jgi:hypothetical protein